MGETAHRLYPGADTSGLCPLYRVLQEGEAVVLDNDSETVTMSQRWNNDLTTRVTHSYVTEP